MELSVISVLIHVFVCPLIVCLSLYHHRCKNVFRVAGSVISSKVPDCRLYGLAGNPVCCGVTCSGFQGPNIVRKYPKTLMPLPAAWVLVPIRLIQLPWWWDWCLQVMRGSFLTLLSWAKTAQRHCFYTQMQIMIWFLLLSGTVPVYCRYSTPHGRTAKVSKVLLLTFVRILSITRPW